MAKLALAVFTALVFILNQVSAELGFPVELGSVAEGSSINFVYGKFGGGTPPIVGVTYYCKIHIEETQSTAVRDVDYTWSLDGTQINDKFVLFELIDPGTTEVTITVDALNDNVNEVAENVKFHGNCYTQPSRRLASIVASSNCNFDLSITNSQVTDDPHFFQNVIGKNELGQKVTENICYDLVGTAGDVYEVLTDELLKVSILCELRDDYYMGQIRIKTPAGLFTADTETVSVGGQFQRSWNDIEKFEKGSDPAFSVELVNNMVVVVYSEKGRRMAIRVEKVQQAGRGKNYLNFFIEETTENSGIVFDRHHGGLFGVAANNQYQFSRPVQEDAKMANVFVNNRRVNAFRQISPATKEMCYLMNLEDIVAPYTKAKFMKSF